jgi:hypothetical protein
MTAKTRAVMAMLRRWEADLVRLEKLFGSYDENDFSNAAEMQRNLGSAATAAEMFLSSRTST